MPDWIGAEGDTTAERYRRMAEHEVRHVSPVYETLCLGVADDPEVLGRLDTLPAPKRQPNLLLAAVRFLDGPVSTWPLFRSFVTDRWVDVAATMRERATQTNEPGRCASLLPVLAGIDGPIALLEVGASAGLCLYPDRWSYRYDAADGVHRVGAGPELTCAASGPVPWPTRLPEVVWRGGVDLHPLAVADPEDVRWLESLIWPGQTGRVERLHDAVAIARAEPATLLAGDLVTDLPALVADVPAGATLVILHSAVLAYVPAALRTGFLDTVRAVATRRPTIWLSNEAPGVVAGTERPRSDRGRFVLAADGRPLALTGPHGQSLDWLGR